MTVIRSTFSPVFSGVFSPAFGLPAGTSVSSSSWSTYTGSLNGSFVAVSNGGTNNPSSFNHNHVVLSATRAIAVVADNTGLTQHKVVELRIGDQTSVSVVQTITTIGSANPFNAIHLCKINSSTAIMGIRNGGSTLPMIKLIKVSNGTLVAGANVTVGTSGTDRSPFVVPTESSSFVVFFELNDGFGQAWCSVSAKSFTIGTVASVIASGGFGSTTEPTPPVYRSSDQRFVVYNFRNQRMQVYTQDPATGAISVTRASSGYAQSVAPLVYCYPCKFGDGEVTMLAATSSQAFTSAPTFSRWVASANALNAVSAVNVTTAMVSTTVTFTGVERLVSPQTSVFVGTMQNRNEGVNGRVVVAAISNNVSKIYNVTTFGASGSQTSANQIAWQPQVDVIDSRRVLVSYLATNSVSVEARYFVVRGY